MHLVGLYTIHKERQCAYKRNIEARSLNSCCHVKVRSITYSEYVSVVFFTYHARRMRRIILSSWAVWAYHIFARYQIIEKKVLVCKTCILIFPITFV